MAKTSVTFAVIFFFSVFFVVSHARTSFNLPANEWKTISTTSSSSSESDTKSSENLQTIQLPTEKSESDAVEKREFVHPIEVEEENLPESDTTTTAATATAITAIGIAEPFKVTYDVSFRPINRHFHHMHLNHPFWYRFPHRHNCHHHHHRHHNNGDGNDNDKSSSVREISYGNDMILSSGSGVDERKSAGFVHPMFRGDLRHIIPARLGQFRAGGDRFPVKTFRVNGGESLTKEMFLTHVEDEKEEEKKETGFMNRFRKFLFDRF